VSTRARIQAAAAPAQSLARGAAGIALWHVERALNDSGSWADAHAAIQRAVREPVAAGAGTGLFYGAPALAFVLHAARADGRLRYQQATDELNGHVLRCARRQIAALRDGNEREATDSFRQADLFHGLAGLGALLLRTAPGSKTLAGVLREAARLTEPRIVDGMEVPGWWAAHDPDPLLPTPGGHANLGMAHGAAGLLALLSLARIHGHAARGQDEAITRLRRWFRHWRQESAQGPWWPQWITRSELASGHAEQDGPGRPSWCYGTIGIARALQLAAIATSSRPWQEEAEAALAAGLSDQQLARLDSPGLCHGIAGVFATAARAASDALTPAITRRLPAVAALLAQHADAADEPGLLTGVAGVQLALAVARSGMPPRSQWDACLLIT
jgi:lantibiotic biosynthesis protein